MAEEPKKKDIPTNEEDLVDEEEIKEKEIGRAHV